MKFPTLDNIVKVNRYHLTVSREDFYEPDNLKERGSLEWVLDVIQHPLLGVDHYPTLVEKAAKLAWHINVGHLFWDGNKRTGMSVLIGFLRRNGYLLNTTSREIVEIARRIAKANTEEGDYTFEEFVQWIRDRIMPMRENNVNID